MRIYIDESGHFIPGGAPSRVCCEAALVVPERVAEELLGEFVSLRASWTTEPELKGSALSDEQTIAALSLVGRYDVLVEIHALDVGDNQLEQIVHFQRGQADAFTNGLTSQHHENAHRWVHALREEWLRLPPQLVAQMYTLILTVGEVIRVAPNYYAQRIPEELARFDWVLDPKDIQPTPFEVLWQKIVCPVLQTDFLKQPPARIVEFDYSAYERFDMPIPEYLFAHLPKGRTTTRDGTGTNLGMLMRESVAFPDSKDEPGLQLIDVIASAFTKAMNGKLPPRVWRLLGPLMVEKPHRAPTARLIAYGPGEELPAGEYHAYVLKALTNRAKKMFVDVLPSGIRAPQ